MTTKRKTKPTQSGKNGALRKVARAKFLARAALEPTMQAGATLSYWSKTLGEQDLVELVAELTALAMTVCSGSLRRQEIMLATQAQTLDAIFNELARRSHTNIVGGYLEAGELHLRLALKAQGQCRATLETLAEIKNPRPVAFVKQQNIAAGPQQVNNTREGSRTREIENPPNKLLEQQYEQRLDTRTPSAAGAIDSQLEPMVTLDGSTIPRREGASALQRLERRGTADASRLSAATATTAKGGQRRVVSAMTYGR